MKNILLIATFLLLAIPGCTATVFGQQNPAVLIAAQRDAMKRLAVMDGQWRGPAWTILPTGVKHEVTQTERIGPFLDGSVKVLEGKGFEPDGKPTFNAFGTIAFNPSTGVYTLHAIAQGMVGDFVLTPTADGYVWEIPAGPVTIRYTATIKDGAWREVGDRIMPGKEPVRFFEMNLKRIGNSDWPMAGSLTLK
ncbi:MAG: DUF1579 domain-containing protein [Acidobacteriota bacterium]